MLLGHQGNPQSESCVLSAEIKILDNDTENTFEEQTDLCVMETQEEGNYEGDEAGLISGEGAPVNLSVDLFSPRRLLKKKTTFTTTLSVDEQPIRSRKLALSN